MPENKYDCNGRQKRKENNLVVRFSCIQLAYILTLLHCLILVTYSQLPSKIFNIEKSFQEVPIINLSQLSSELESVTLLMDTGSSQLAIFDDRCDKCEHTFSACPHVKNSSNQTFISYLLTQFKGDFSYLTLGNSIRMRFFCVIQVQGNQNGLQTNGVLGIQIKKMSLIEKVIKQTNGIKVWKQIMQKVYEKDLNEFESLRQGSNSKDIRLKYSIFYSPYHTKLLLGQIPEVYSKKMIGELSLTLETIGNALQYFPSQMSEDQTQNKGNQEFTVHFDSGSSVIALPVSQLQDLLIRINKKMKDSCKIQNMQIRCQQSSIKSLIESGFKFQISLYQFKDDKELNSLTLSINLQNLIQKSHKKEQNSWIILKIIGFNNTNEESMQYIILGVPFFKQYLFQYDIPFDMEKKGPLQSIKSSINSNQQYKLILYDPRFKDDCDLLSPYEHQLKRYEKNIKIFTFFYLFFVFVFSYLLIKIFWWLYSFIKGKRQLV